MIKTIHIKLLLLISLSILFGHSAFGQFPDFADKQNVCLGDPITYTAYGFTDSPEMFMEIYDVDNNLESIRFKTKEIVTVEAVSYNKFTFEKTWGDEGVFTVKIKEVGISGCEGGNSNVLVVTVGDSEAPKIISFPDKQEVCADIKTDGTVLSTAKVDDIALTDISDNCTAVLTVSYEIRNENETDPISNGTGDVSGYLFPLGINTVTYKVTDGAGLSSECSFTITVYERPNPSKIRTD